jgi:hypothetical protein
MRAKQLRITTPHTIYFSASPTRILLSCVDHKGLFTQNTIVRVRRNGPGGQVGYEWPREVTLSYFPADPELNTTQIKYFTPALSNMMYIKTQITDKAQIKYFIMVYVKTQNTDMTQIKYFIMVLNDTRLIKD